MAKGQTEVSAGAAGPAATAVWEFDNPRIGGHPTRVVGNPKFKKTGSGTIVEFGGTTDALVVETHPLAGAHEFTVEAVFRPDPAGTEEQRFLHLDTDESNRMLLEMRVLGSDMWFLDTFVLTNGTGCTLYAEEHRHPLGVWYHVALVVDGSEMRHYVNGKQEMSAPLKYVPVEQGKTSIGCRMNRVSWFKGAIRSLRFSQRALTPEEMTVVISDPPVTWR